MQVLQTFHRAKPHKGSPLKTTHLEKIRGKSFVYEAREDQFYNESGYNDHFRNTVCNFEVNKVHPCENLTETFYPVIYMLLI